MANIKSAIKRIRQNDKARLRNKAIRSKVATYTKLAFEAAGTDNAAEAHRMAIKHIDRAATKGIFHKNTAARKKSRLASALKNV